MANRRRVTRRRGMALRASTIAKRLSSVSWTSLPAEIRLMVLETITQQKHPGWASAAAVCREWQLCIEKRNFHRLKLRVSCIDDFERLVVRQRTLVRHLRFDIVLPGYTCPLCERAESWSWARGNDSIIGRGIWKLFRVLSTWKPAGSGLTLELNAHSPSDSDHWFKNYYFASDDEGDEDAAASVQGTDCGRWHDPQHGWVNGQQVTTPPPSAIRRLFGSPWIDLGFREELPQVGTVTCFIIRRQLRRSFRPWSPSLIVNKLPYLEALIYEPWRQWEADWTVLNDEHFLYLVQKHLPQTLNGYPSLQISTTSSPQHSSMASHPGPRKSTPPAWWKCGSAWPLGAIPVRSGSVTSKLMV